MSRLKPTKDARTTYDSKNGAVRSFFGTELVDDPPMGAAAFHAKAPAEKAGDFLSANKDLFQLDKVSVKETERREGASTESLRYSQEHDAIPVYGAELVVGLEKGGKVASAVNQLDYEIPQKLTRDQVKLTADQAVGEAKKQLGAIAEKVVTGPPTLYIYRYHPRPPVDTPRPDAAKQAKIEGLDTGKEGQAYLAWLVPADTDAPSGNWNVFVGAVNGEIISVRSRRRYAAVKGMVFMPDPITSSQNSGLSSATPALTLDPQRKEVDLENLAAPTGGVYRLDGKWAICKELESPSFPPPTATTEFKYGSKDRNFLSVMAYYWVDRVVTYLYGLGNPTYKAAVEHKRISLDAQGVNGDDNSHFTTDASGQPYLAFGEGGVPDASDAHVIAHEYGHAMHFYMGTSQNANGSEEGYGDFLAGSWLDRFNIAGFQRESVFPWDNNSSSSDHYSDDRFFNTPRKFSDSDYNHLEIHIRGSVLAATLWDLYNSLGANPAAADTVNKLYMEMLISVANNAPVSDLAKGLVTADQALNAGANKTKIKAAFANRGLAI